MNTVSLRPGKNDAKVLPVIHNDKELEVYTNALFQLTALETRLPQSGSNQLPDLTRGTLRASALRNSRSGCVSVVRFLSNSKALHSVI